MMIIELINNLTLILTLSVLYALISKYLSQNKILGQLLFGSLFGVIAIFGMMNPYTFEHGIVFDGRSVIISIAALFGGPLTAATSAVIAICYRIWLGGIGAFTGAIVIITSAIIGLFFYFLDKLNKIKKNILILTIMGFIVHLAMLLLMLTLPGGIGYNIILAIALPVLVLFTLSTTLLGSILLDQISKNKALNKIFASEQKFRNLFENSPVGISLTGIDGSLFVNQAFCEMIGYTKEELKSMKWFDVSHTEDFERSSKIVKSLLDGKIQKENFEKRYIHKNGNIIWANVSIFLDRSVNNEPGYFLTVVIDTTERKKIELNMIESEKKYSSLFASSNEGIAIHKLIQDESGKNIDYEILDVNNAYEKLTGLKKEDSIGKKATELYKTETAPYIETYSEVSETGKPKKFEIAFKPMNAFFRISAFSYEKGTFITLFSDITEAKKAEQELTKHREHLEVLVKERTSALEKNNKELERFNNLFAEREFRIKELKEKVKALEVK